ncbi:hypothetical protein OQA88_8290 [Cercophora sp. LCS_1]
MAGMFPVTLIKEPEAAALYTIHSLDFTLNTGDAFVVCDAGGGTVDLISYEVVGVKPNLQLKELVPGTGCMAGSLGLNQRFVEAVKNLVGVDQFQELRKAKGLSHAQKTFDQDIKKSFRGKPEEEHFVNFPMASLDDMPHAGLVSNTWKMTGRDLKNIFSPIVNDILRLISDQVKSVELKRPNQGITGSSWLIQVLQPGDAWAAVAKGAALSILPQRAVVVSTLSTKHYGVEAREGVDDVLDAGQPTMKLLDGTTRVEKMTWFVGIGEDFHRDQEVKFSFFVKLRANYQPSDLTRQVDLIECNDFIAPRYYSKGRQIRTDCTLTVNLQYIKKEDPEEKKDQDDLP